MEREQTTLNPKEYVRPPAKPSELVLDIAQHEQLTDLLEREPLDRKIFLKIAQDFLLDKNLDEETL